MRVENLDIQYIDGYYVVHTIQVAQKGKKKGQEVLYDKKTYPSLNNMLLHTKGVDKTSLIDTCKKAYNEYVVEESIKWHKEQEVKAKAKLKREQKKQEK